MNPRSRAVFCALGLTTLAFSQTNPDQPSRGAVLYSAQCAVCHGSEGDADTVVARFLRPRPTAFRDGSFKLVSTTNGVPTEEDLVQTLRRGMPGSTMMSWDWLPESDLRELAREVGRLAVRGRAAALQDTALVAGRPLTLEEATQRAARELTPGPAVDVGRAAGGDAGEGKRLFTVHCAACHGADGRGLAQIRQWQQESTYPWPRDLTLGVLRGGGSDHDLALRIRAGMPGAHMPPTPLSSEQTADLVAHIKSLLPPDANERHLQRRQTVPVARLEEAPHGERDEELAHVPAMRLPLAPLWWRDEACQETWVRAAHDGTDLVLRLDWSDATRDDRARPDAAMGDGAAIQFARSADTPLLAMGTLELPVNVWRWHAYDPHETAGMTDVLERSLHQGLDVPMTDWKPRPRTESIEMSGVASAASAIGGGLPVRVTTRWRDGRWTATFRRALRARDSHEVDLQSGPVLIAIAIWDGSIDPHPGSKSITTWHVLDLRP
jgi:DMSO reductase family type II enzyme heme b subunit